MSSYITETEITYKRISLKGKTGGWSKWGGARSSVLKEKIDNEWTCQSCASRMPEEMTPYIYEFEPKEYIRVCASCLRDDCRSLRQRRSSI